MKLTNDAILGIIINLEKNRNIMQEELDQLEDQYEKWDKG